MTIDPDVDFPQDAGERIFTRVHELARFSDPPFAARGELTVTYLTAAHRECAAMLAEWMREAAFDDVREDAIGNVVGVYHARDAGARRLLTGSHYDTVRNAGRFDGRLGVLVAIECVRALATRHRRLPFAIEVIAFAEEEGQRYETGFLASRALVGRFDPAWLEQRDAAGIGMRDAMHAAGLPGTIEAIRALQRNAEEYLGYVEVHIEQGPVLHEAGVPLGIVTAINGGIRHAIEIVGTPSHAGTTPMDRRHDAATAAAEVVLHAEARARSVPGLVATVGMLDVPGGSVNVVPGRCRMSLDVRAPRDEVRDAACADILAHLQEVCARRGVVARAHETMRVPAAPSDPAWQRRWEAAVASIGVPVLRLPSGAGHDAMMLHGIMPQAMLFVRGEHGGISHNPLESTTAEDIQLAARAMAALLERLATER